MSTPQKAAIWQAAFFGGQLPRRAVAAIAAAAVRFSTPSLA
jgi:hypothetical protein